MSTNTLTYSSELMKNFLQAEIMAPDKKFEALQDKTGHSLLFSIGTDGVFYCTQESSGSEKGWNRIDLSSALLAKSFEGKSGVQIRTFDAAQNITNGTLELAITVTDGKTDTLFLSLSNSDLDTSWLHNPSWEIIEYDNPNNTEAVLSIQNIYISELLTSSTGSEYIFVDIEKDPANNSKLINRYYIDLKKTDGYYWHEHNLNIDLEENGYSSTVGRSAGQTIDGMYTIGTVGGLAQFIYQPVFNIWKPNIPAPVARLNLPGKIIPEAISTFRNSDGSTDLLAISQGALYYFSSTNQKDSDTGALIFKNEIFTGCTFLKAYQSDTSVFFWGLNQANQVFYSTCPKNEITKPSSWRYPLPILTGVDLISPYVNKENQGNTFFAVGGDLLHKMYQSPSTSIWTSQQVTLPPPKTTTPANSFSSYTTRIQVVDENKLPKVNFELKISAETRGTFIINNLYYVLGTNPIPINTDAHGSLTIIESIGNINGTKLTVTDGVTTVKIDPMKKPLNKVASLNTPEKIKAATITKPDGSTSKLVSGDLPKSDLELAAQTNQTLGNEYTEVAKKTPKPMEMAVYLPHPTVQLESIGDKIAADFGDLEKWLEHAVDFAVKFVKDAASGFLSFVVKIGDKTFHALLDCAEKIASAAKWVFNAIKTAIKDVLKFLEFLFEWQDIIRTKKVMKNLFQIFLQHEVDQIEVFKKEMNAEFAKAISAINKWADIPDNWDGLGKAAKQTPASRSDSSSGKDSTTTYLSHHFQNNAKNTSHKKPQNPVNAPSDPMEVLFDAIKKEGQIFDQVIDELEKLSSDFKDLDLGSFLKKLVAILADGVLESVENVLDALLDLLYLLAKASVKALEAPIHIPVISDILEDIGIPEFSIVDIVTLIAAVPVTIGYKIANNETPFPKSEHTNYLIQVKDFKTLQNDLNGGSTNQTLFTNTMALSEKSSSGLVPERYKEALYVMGHTGGAFLIFVSTIVTGFEAMEETGQNPIALPSAAVNFAAMGMVGGVNLLIPKDPLKQPELVWISRGTLITVILCKILFSGPVQAKFGEATGIMKNLKMKDGRAVGAIINCILIIPALTCSIYHFYELGKEGKSAVEPDHDDAIIDETSNITSYIQRIAYCVAVNNKNPEVKGVSVGVMSVASLITCGLQFAEVAVNASGSNSN